MAGARTVVGPQIDGKHVFLAFTVLVLVGLVLTAVLTSLKALFFLAYVFVGSIVCMVFLMGFFVLAEKYGERVLYWLGLVSSRKSS